MTGIEEYALMGIEYRLFYGPDIVSDYPLKDECKYMAEQLFSQIMGWA